jgi:Xaa-Pro aminopeptidase
VIFTNPERNRNNDFDYRYRPSSDFWYLTGCDEPDAALVLAPGGVAIDDRRVTELLLVNVSDRVSDTWLGYRMGPTNAMRLLGIEFALPNSRFDDVAAALAQSGASMAPALVPPDPSGPMAKWVAQVHSLKATGADVDLRQTIDRMRVKKSPEEISLMRHAARASVAGHIQAMKSARPGMREFEIQALVEYVFGRLGCESVAYNSIVGSGPNSTILHYEADRRLMQAGDIVCMDVAGEYHGYAADVTRSYPVSGKFSPAQLAIYNIVRAAQAAGIRECLAGRPFAAPDKAARRVVTAGLLKLGIIKTAADAETYFMHGTSHYLGLDVHDSYGDATLRSGCVLTVEPGIYIRAGSKCDPKWWNIGIRIEDDVLVTDREPDVLTAGAPRDPAQIEALMKRNGIGEVPLG